jgi:arsenate reductase-like glutaredoxin family protein
MIGILLRELESALERPLVIKDGKRAVLGRPPENVDALL